MSYIVRDWHCAGCGHTHEKMTDRTVASVWCPACTACYTTPRPSAPSIAYLRMGVDRDFSTAADKWDTAHAKQKRLEAKAAE